MLKRDKVQLAGEDMREGLTCVLSVKMPDPKFSSQTKDKLVSSEVGQVVSSVIGDALARWFERAPGRGQADHGQGHRGGDAPARRRAVPAS